MRPAYELFRLPRAHEAQDSPLILCFRELWGRLERGLEPTALDLDQIEHMAQWLDRKVVQYDETPPCLAELERAIQEGWQLLLEGVLSLAGYLEQGGRELLLQALELAEEGEELLKQLEEAIVEGRDT